MDIIFKFLPGLKPLFYYKKEWFARDLIAGLSVAVIALPIGLALAGLVGLPPETGIYSTIFPMIIFAVFATSKQMILGPDAPTCMIIASVLIPYASSGKGAYYETCLVISLMVGVISILGGILRFGFISDFLSKPILIGYLNGLTLSIIMSQVDKIFGFSMISSGFLRMLIDFFSKLSATNYTSLTMGIATIAFLLVSRKLFPKFPAAFAATILGGLAVYLFELQKSGIAVVGNFPPGLPSFGIPSVNPDTLISLIPGVLSIVLISYCSAMLTDKSFAVKNNQDIDANKEFIAFGAAGIAAGLSGGFVASGADSLTAVADSTGSKTSLTSIIAALALIVVLFFLASPMAYLPFPTLNAIVIVSVLDLLNIAYLKKLYRIRKFEFLISLITTICVISVGVMYAIIIAVGFALINLIKRSSKPTGTIIGRIGNTNIFAGTDEYKDALKIPGMLIYKFNSALVFYNSDFFRSRIRKLVSASGEKIEEVLIEASAINYVDTTAIDMLEELASELSADNIRLSFACTQKEIFEVLERSGFTEMLGKELFFTSVSSAVDEFEKRKTIVSGNSKQLQ